MTDRTLSTTSLSIIAMFWLSVGGASASAEELKPYAFRKLSLETMRGTVYFRHDGQEFDVVANLSSNEHPLHLVTSLRPRQGLFLSAPVSLGDPTMVVKIRREDDKVTVVDHASTETLTGSPSDIDLSSGP
jgi:hypothetical protein